MKNAFSFCVAVCLVVLYPVFSVTTVFAGEVETVTIGVCLAQTGEMSAAGRKALAGIRLRMDDYNRQVNQTGKLIELVIRDDYSTAEGAAKNMREFADNPEIKAVIGPTATTLMLAMADTARDVGIVVVSPSVTSARIGKNEDWCFRVLFDDQFQGTALARYIREELGLTSAGAILNDRFVYGQSVFGAFKERFEAEGGKVVAEEHYEWVADEDRMFDFTPILQRMNRIDPDIILLPVYSTEVAAIIRTSLLVGVDARFCGGDTWHHELVPESSGSNVENSFFISGIDFDSGSHAMERFLNLYDYSNDPDAQPTSVLGYDALSLLIKAMEHGTDRAAIKEGMYRIKNFDIASGTITIDRKRGSEKTAFVQLIVRDEDNHFVVKTAGEVAP